MLSVSANLLPRVSIDESLVNSLASLLSIAEFLEFKQIGLPSSDDEDDGKWNIRLVSLLS